MTSSTLACSDRLHSLLWLAVALPESMSNAGQGLRQHFEWLGGAFSGILLAASILVAVAMIIRWRTLRHGSKYRFVPQTVDSIEMQAINSSDVEDDAHDSMYLR
eukprot:m.23060 g.23060  ORF g.23060 m.23060 type:complete len:104 (+) comp11326_c0_seq2:293-604(+)